VSGHVRILYTDYYDVAIVFVCDRLLFRGLCAADGNGRVAIYTRIPSLSEERRRSMEDQLRYHGFAGVAGFISKAGFNSTELTTIVHRRE